MSLPILKRVPEMGFYYHYKHDPSGPINNYAYEIIGIGFHTEHETSNDEKHFLIYRPLYEASVYKASKELGIPCFDNRPLAMWMEEIEKDGKKFFRFQKINDPETIRKLEAIRDEMYK